MSDRQPLLNSLGQASSNKDDNDGNNGYHLTNNTFQSNFNEFVTFFIVYFIGVNG